MLILIIVLIFASVVLLGSQIIPVILNKFQGIQDKKVEEAERKLDTMFVRVNREKLILLYTIFPLAGLITGFLFFNNIFLSVLAGAVGFIFPGLILSSLEKRRRQLFQKQLPDGIMVLASSLKGGLSLLQAIEVLSEDIPAPFSQEFGLVVRENKFGVTLEDSLIHLHKRMRIEELDLVINSILVAKETGGDLTKVLSRLSATIRDNLKLKDNVLTLTLQGRLQGIIMSALPIVFVCWVMFFNRSHFDIMLNTDTGKMLLFVAGFLQVLGAFLIHKFSSIKV